MSEIGDALKKITEPFSRMAEILKGIKLVPIEDEDPEEELTTEGLTYVAIGLDCAAVVLETECGFLANDLSEVGGSPGDVGLSVPDDMEPGIYKAVVKLHVYTDWEGHSEASFRPVGPWEETDQFPEPWCDFRTENPNEPIDCAGMLRTRSDSGVWACDVHAGRVA